MPNEQMAKIIVNSAFRVHKRLGTSLLEKGYEAGLVYVITKVGFEVKRQEEVTIAYDRVTLKEYLRSDILVKN
jgi:GxxExxY protein